MTKDKFIEMAKKAIEITELLEKDKMDTIVASGVHGMYMHSFRTGRTDYSVGDEMTYLEAHAVAKFLNQRNLVPIETVCLDLLGTTVFDIYEREWTVTNVVMNQCGTTITCNDGRPFKSNELRIEA